MIPLNVGYAARLNLSTTTATTRRREPLLNQPAYTRHRSPGDGDGCSQFDVRPFDASPVPSCRHLPTAPGFRAPAIRPGNHPGSARVPSTPTPPATTRSKTRSARSAAPAAPALRVTSLPRLPNPLPSSPVILQPVHATALARAPIDSALADGVRPPSPGPSKRMVTLPNPPLRLPPPSLHALLESRTSSKLIDQPVQARPRFQRSVRPGQRPLNQRPYPCHLL